MPPPLLVLSNGHGEDLIARRIVEALQRRVEGLDIAVLPLVGEGEIFAAAVNAGQVRRVGPRRPLPSGGFSNQSLRGLARDLAAGLPQLSWRQWTCVRAWGRSGAPVLAVGDLLPLLLARASGAPFGFLGTPKSDFTWASPPPPGWGHSPLADGYHRCKGSEWDPWEWELMRHRRCHLVAVRDRLTARGLRRHGVAALAPGNPMMDGFGPAAGGPPPWLARQRRLLLLPGSRMPEALDNAGRMLAALASWTPEAPTAVLVASASQPTSAAWHALLIAGGWRSLPQEPDPAAMAALSCWSRGNLTLLLGSGCFNRWAPWAEVGLATAGTATEQLAGLGVPALSLPGAGPQFKAGFARRQSRLLGGAVQPCHGAAELGDRLTELLRDPHLRARLGRVGRRRMGPPGGSERLADLVAQRLLRNGRLG